MAEARDKALPPTGGRFRAAALWFAPLVATAMLLFVDLQPGRPQVTAAAAVAVWMAIWWIAETVPLAVTAMLPVVLFPLLGVMSGKAVAAQYFNHIIFLFIGGFLVALAMQRWDLHHRIALRILLWFGVRPASILLGFMVATAFLSMWISNTATAMMMATIASAIILKLEDSVGVSTARPVAVALLLAVAYSASIGGIATLVGTPPNMSFARIFEIQYPTGPAISFSRWSLFALPISVTLLLFTWAFLSVVHLRRIDHWGIDRSLLQRQYDELGPMSFPEKVVLADFAVLVVLWVFRADVEIGSWTVPGWSRLVPTGKLLNDGTVAMALALVLFLIPSRRDGGRIIDWPTAARLPWHIILLFGGGFALARGFVDSGLSQWLGDQLHMLRAWPPWLLITLVCLGITFLTELTSNTATTEMILPVLAGLATAIDINPLFLMVPVTISCSCAFMMPVATPPNAIMFATGRLRVADMARAGVLLNLVGVVVVVIGTALLGRAVWGIDVARTPHWAAPPAAAEPIPR